MRRIRFFGVVCILLLLLSAFACFAEQQRVFDTAGAFTEAQAYEIGKTLDYYSENCSLDIAVLFVSSLDGIDPQEYAENWYDDNRRGYDGTDDGVLLLVCPDSRDYQITTSGRAVYELGDYQLDVIEGAVLAKLQRNDWEGAAIAFAESIDTCINSIDNDYSDDHYGDISYTVDIDEVQGDGSNIYVDCIFVALGIGAVVSLIILLVMKSGMNNVKQNRTAGNYLVGGTFNLTCATEMFLHRSVTRTPKPDNNTSSRTGSGGFRSGGGHSHGGSGHSHGGRGGKF